MRAMHFGLTLAAATTAMSLTTAVAQDYEISRYTIDSGGEMRSTGGDYELSGTIGQPDASELSGGTYSLTGGFWFEIPRGDCNADGIVNLLDHADFVPCLDGPDAGLNDSACRCFDFDDDDDIDLLDFAEFQEAFAGS